MGEIEDQAESRARRLIHHRKSDQVHDSGNEGTFLFLPRRRFPLTFYKSEALLSPLYRSPMPDYRNELIQGTLDLLVLRTLAAGGPMHGWGVAQRIQLLSRDALVVNQGSLYPALHRLEKQGLIEAEWGVSDNNRQAKFYQLTKGGRRQLADETAYWQRFTSAVDLVLKAGPT